MSIIKIEKFNCHHLKDVVKLHRNEITYGFGTYLGNGFLKYLYKNIIHSDDGIGYVAIYENTVVGFIASTTNLKIFYKRFLIKYSVIAGILSLHKILRPKAVKSILQNLFYPSKENKIDLPEAEIISIAISPKVRGKGVGRMLTEKTLDEFKARKIKQIKVLVGDKLKSNGFYKKIGFRFVYHEVYDSDKMDANIYIKDLDEN